MLLTNAQANREDITLGVRQWGGLASDAALDEGCQYFSLPHVEGFIAFRQENGCAIVLGHPICPESDMPELTQAFHYVQKKQGRHVIYIAVPQNFTKWALQHVCESAIEFGEEMIMDPYDDPQMRKGANAHVVRRKVRHALKEHVIAVEYCENNPMLEEAIKQVGHAWLKARRGPQIHIAKICLFTDRLGKRWFYAKQDERVVGVLVLTQLQANQGWLLSRIMVSPDAPKGTPELLVTTTLGKLASEGCHFVTVGIVPRIALGEIIGLSTYGMWASRCLYKLAKKVFYLGGTKPFWEKFHPHQAPSYLLFSEKTISIRDLIGLARAMNASF